MAAPRECDEGGLTLRQGRAAVATGAGRARAAGSTSPRATGSPDGGLHGHGAVTLAVVAPSRRDGPVLVDGHDVGQHLDPTVDAGGEPQQGAGGGGIAGGPAVVRPPCRFPSPATTRRSWTTSQPVGVCHVVSSTMVPGTYRRWWGTSVFVGPKRKLPAVRSSRAPKTLGESGRGRHRAIPPNRPARSDSCSRSPTGTRTRRSAESSRGSRTPQMCLRARVSHGENGTSRPSYG